MQRSGKRKRSTMSACNSPRPAFLARHSSFNWYDADIWTEIAKFLDGKCLVKLGMANRWFHRLIMEESVWKYASVRDLQVLAPSDSVSCNWRRLYSSAFDGSHSYSFRQQEKHIDWMRIGAFFFDSDTALLSEQLSLPIDLRNAYEDPGKSIRTSGYCLLTNIKPGIWIADLQLVRCPVCNLHTCEGTMQILDARYAELFLQEEFRNGTWDFEEIGVHKIEKHSASAAGAIFDVKHLAASCTARVLDTNSWVGCANDWQPKARIGLHAVAVNTNLQPNEGLNVKFQVMKAGAKGKVVSIRISQQLL